MGALNKFAEILDSLAKASRTRSVADVLADYYSTRAAVLADASGKRSVAKASVPEELLLGAPHEDLVPRYWDGRPKPVDTPMSQLPVGVRWQREGAIPYSNDVYHYDVSGGTALPDIIRQQPFYHPYDVRSGAVPPNMTLRDRLSAGVVRFADLRDINAGRYVPFDPFGEDIPAVSARRQPVFYPNEAEGRLQKNYSGMPRKLDINDIINDAEMRKELNLSVAVPGRSEFHKKSVQLKAKGGLAQLKECTCG